MKGPLVLAVNHPNSFLDAIILATLFDEPLYSLARGDAFKNKFIASLLKSINILPVFREREGAEHLHRNYDTFYTCRKILKEGGIVLIFTEALSENEWHLRPLKKGTARLAVTAWQENIPVKILPVALNYSDFHAFGKNVHINLGNPIAQDNMHQNLVEQGKLLNEITAAIHQQLSNMVYEIDASDKAKLSATFTTSVSHTKKIVLALPALLGYITNGLLYWPIQKIVSKKALYSGHYDSIIISVLSILYPVYLLALTLLLVFSGAGYWSLLVWLLCPFFAWSYVQLKPQTNS